MELPNLGVAELLIIGALCAIPSLAAVAVAAWLVIRSRNRK